MTRDQFRSLALALPEAIEASHHGQPDFRIGGRIFASLPAGSEERATIMLTTSEQDALVHAHPKAFSPVPGGWGRRGATRVELPAARVAVVREALELAWRARSQEAAEGALKKGTERENRSRAPFRARAPDDSCRLFSRGRILASATSRGRGARAGVAS